MFYKKVLDYCKKKNLSISGFEQKCGLANGTVGKWKDGGNPRLETLEKIAKATGVSEYKWLK
jgi:transcriptional regulator with XRE-family HTH domain